MGKELFVVGAWLAYPDGDVIIMGTSACLLGFFLDFLAAILFLDSTCFHEDSFISSRQATDFKVAPCLAKLRRRQLRRNKIVNRLNTPFSEAIPKHVHMSRRRGVLGEFLGEHGQVLFHGLLVR